MVINSSTISDKLYIKGRIGWKGLKKEEYLENSDFRIINATALHNGEIDWTDCGYISKERYDESSEIMLKEKDILISKDGTIGKIGFVNNLNMKTTVASGIFVVRNLNEEEIDTDYLYYFFKSPYFKWFIKSATEGSVVPHLYQRDFEKMEINLFDKETQIKISTILNNIENKIKINNRINNNLEQLSERIFKEWFLLYNFPNSKNLPYKENEGLFKNTKLGEIPELWDVVKIGDINLLITDYVANGSFASLKENVTILDNENYAYFIRNTDLKNDIFEKYVDKHSYEFLHKSKLFGDEILISNVGDVGSIHLCPTLDKPMTLGNNMIMIRSETDIKLEYYLYLLLKSEYGTHLLDGITGGSVQSKFNKTDFKSLKIILPNKEILIKYNEIINPLFNQIKKNTKEIKKLTQLRDTLLPKLMSGEIDVSKINFDLKLEELKSE